MPDVIQKVDFKDCLQMMQPGTKKAYESIKKLMDKDDCDQIKARWKIGKMINEIKNTPKTYGSRAIENIAKCLGCHRSWLDDCDKVYDAWKRETSINARLKERDVRNRPPTWSHLVLFASERGAEQNDFIKKWKDHGWSVRELKKYMYEKVVTPTIPLPGHLKGHLRKLVVAAKTQIEHDGQLDTTIFNKIDNDADAQTEETLDLLVDAYNAEMELIASAEITTSAIEERIAILLDKFGIDPDEFWERSEDREVANA